MPRRLAIEIGAKFEENLKDLENGLNVEGVGVVDCGRAHLINIQGLIKVAKNSAKKEIDFRLYDNSTIKVNLEQLKK
ncbi:MAG: hypothetical protein ACTTJC_06090 [Campylobacter sp.]